MSAPTTPIIKTIILTDGEKGILPSTANIISVAIEGFSSVTSSCGNLPTPVPLLYYRLQFATDIPDDGGSDAWLDDDTQYHGVVLNGIVTSFDSPIAGGDMSSLKAALIQKSPYLLNIKGWDSSSNPPSRRERNFVFKSTQEIINTFRLLVGVNAYGGISNPSVYISAYEITESVYTAATNTY